LLHYGNRRKGPQPDVPAICGWFTKAPIRLGFEADLDLRFALTCLEHGLLRSEVSRQIVHHSADTG